MNTYMKLNINKKAKDNIRNIVFQHYIAFTLKIEIFKLS